MSRRKPLRRESQGLSVDQKHWKYNISKRISGFTVEYYRRRNPAGRTVSGVDQVTMPKAAFDALMQQISALQATVDRLTATIEEKDRIIAEKIEIILNLNRA